MKLLSLILILVCAISQALANDQDSLALLPFSTIQMDFDKVVIPAQSNAVDLGNFALTSGRDFGCTLLYNATDVERVMDGKLQIIYALADYQANGHRYRIMGKYLFNGNRIAGFVTCYSGRGGIRIGDFKEYLQKINGTITTP